MQTRRTLIGFALMGVGAMTALAGNSQLESSVSGAFQRPTTSRAAIGGRAIHARRGTVVPEFAKPARKRIRHMQAINFIDLATGEVIPNPRYGHVDRAPTTVVFNSADVPAPLAGFYGLNAQMPDPTCYYDPNCLGYGITVPIGATRNNQAPAYAAPKQVLDANGLLGDFLDIALDDYNASANWPVIPSDPDFLQQPYITDLVVVVEADNSGLPQRNVFLDAFIQDSFTGAVTYAIRGQFLLEAGEPAFIGYFDFSGLGEVHDAFSTARGTLILDYPALGPTEQQRVGYALGGGAPANNPRNSQATLQGHPDPNELVSVGDQDGTSWLLFSSHEFDMLDPSLDAGIWMGDPLTATVGDIRLNALADPNGVVANGDFLTYGLYNLGDWADLNDINFLDPNQAFIYATAKSLSFIVKIDPGAPRDFNVPSTCPGGVNPPQDCSCDNTGDCLVDLSDLAGLLSQFSLSGELNSDCAGGGGDGRSPDGIVDLRDLAGLLSQFANDCDSTDDP
ncbi:MAG: hypothetical protein KDA32_02350 [Phycisphaerales bacterium]|nr:hypothetical protein [Phycisphaerales bacterium]